MTCDKSRIASRFMSRDTSASVTRLSRDQHLTPPHHVFCSGLLWCLWLRPNPSNGLLQRLDLAMNDHEAQRIAAAMHELRPDWPTSSLLTLIRKNLIDKPRRDVTVALAWVACESGTATPARVLEAGPWWRAVASEGSTYKPNTWEPDKVCTTCSKPEAKCLSTRFADDDHVFVSRAQNAQVTVRPVDALHRIVTDLREQRATNQEEA